MIKKVVKLQIVLLITSSCIFVRSFSQSPAKIDSIKLKRELDSVLAKYGLKSKGFAINVISINQQGGQTAYSITNNYYSDTMNAQNNFSFDTAVIDGYTWVNVYPKKGIWSNPFIGLDSITEREYYYDVGAGLTTTIHGLYITLADSPKPRNLLLYLRQGVCSKNIPMKVQLLKKNAFFAFGDWADEEKFYLYYKGTATIISKKKDEGN